MRLIYHNFSGGMFSMVKSVLSYVKPLHEAGTDFSLTISGSPYMEDGYKGDIWTRFWTPLGIPKSFGEEKRFSDHPGYPFNDYWYRLRQPIHNLISSLSLRPSFIVPYLPRNTIAVHYRATDKGNEYQSISIEKYAQTINVLKEKLGVSEYFLASDSDVAIHQMSALAPGAVYFDHERSKELYCGYGTHFTIKDRGKAGMEAITDVYNLAKADFLIAGASNLSEFATYLNPNIILVNMR